MSATTKKRAALKRKKRADEEQKKAEEKSFPHTHCVTTDVSDKNASLKDDVFYRGRGAIAACDATTTTTTTRNTETNARGDFPASLSEK